MFRKKEEAPPPPWFHTKLPLERNMEQQRRATYVLVAHCYMRCYAASAAPIWCSALLYLFYTCTNKTPLAKIFTQCRINWFPDFPKPFTYQQTQSTECKILFKRQYSNRVSQNAYFFEILTSPKFFSTILTQKLWKCKKIPKKLCLKGATVPR